MLNYKTPLGLVILAAVFFLHETASFYYSKILDGVDPTGSAVFAFLPEWQNLVGIVCLMIACVMFVWQYWHRDNLKWNKSSVLRLIFNGDLTSAYPDRQDGVLWYYWQHIPGVLVDFEQRQIAQPPGYVEVFLSLPYPTAINYQSVAVIGGAADIRGQIVSAHASGALVKFFGDLRGRTIEIKFSEAAIQI